MMFLVNLLFAVVVFCAAYWAVRKVLSAFGVGDPVAGVVEVAFVFVVLFWVLSWFGFVRF